MTGKSLFACSENRMSSISGVQRPAIGVGFDIDGDISAERETPMKKPTLGSA